jgi:hypothetical protein
VVEIDKGVGRPEPLAEFLPGHQFARLFEEQGQNLKGLVLQFDSETVLSEFAGAQVQFEAGETEEIAVFRLVFIGLV